MARYIKVNPLVADYLNLCNDRNTVKDGNYLLWQADMLRFGPLTQLTETLKQIGGLALMPHEAKEEQDGTVVRDLPIAEDPRFVYGNSVNTEGDNSTQTTEGVQETEDPQPSVDTGDNNSAETTEGVQGDGASSSESEKDSQVINTEQQTDKPEANKEEKEVEHE
ncbi:hypothetical protein ONT15_05205 [Prevotella copri]|uniref:Uncharacterized protein n=1 Tax=Segatella copri TaxID=165179 RepID=A0AAW5U7K4_9BACT|nr:hypothetical protein [Segatella copri]MCW4098800.1 hypothetical protein [Segatella copri]MCW4132820.1 hypothetical protein [Segatella copri]MCW4163140.1 hypothetical protein [Segatella copri]